MFDIWLGFGFVTVISLLLISGVARLTKTISARTRVHTAIGIISAGAMFVFFVWDDVRLAKLLPFSNLIIIGNFLPYFVSALVGLIASDQRLQVARRAVAISALVAVAVFASVRPILGAAPRCGNWWDEGICRQSTEYTCSAACATTMLEAAGIEATEQEMAELCCSRNGTVWTGLYRGLSLKTGGTDFRVKTFVGNLETLRNLDLQDRPIILTVGLTKEAARKYPSYTRHWGWKPGTTHTVLFYGVTIQGAGLAPTHHVEIGDPSVGREQWTMADLDVLWNRSAQMLVRKYPTAK